MTATATDPAGDPAERRTGERSAGGSGVFIGADIEALVASGAIATALPPGAGQVQPASFDLRLGPVAYRVRSSFLPLEGRRVADMLDRHAMHTIDMSKGAVLERQCFYVVPLLESLALPRGLGGTTNPKSSTGRLDVFTRVIADGTRRFDMIGAGYHGPLYAEISPKTFPVLLREGSRLSQVRFRTGHALPPSPALNADTRDRIGGTVCAALSKLKYRSAGTVEFLYENGQFYFIEMNTRLQVEHPVTEMISGVDIVREQIRVAADGPLSLTQDEIVLSGHAIECRINAEHAETFIPSPGRITEFHAPGGLGVRVDSALYSGYSVPPFYDSLVAKLIVHGKTRNECLMRLRRALEEFVIGGIETTIPLHVRLVNAENVLNGDYHIHWLEQWLAEDGKG